MQLLLPEIMNVQKRLKDRREFQDVAMKLVLLKKRYKIKNFSYLFQAIQVIYNNPLKKLNKLSFLC